VTHRAGRWIYLSMRSGDVGAGAWLPDKGETLEVFIAEAHEHREDCQPKQNGSLFPRRLCFLG
jgi:hypothetical protein